MLGGIGHFAQAFALLRILRIALGNVGQPHDGVHRRADFVAHIGQESALGAVGRFRLVLRLVEFGGAFDHDGFKVQTVTFKLGLRAFFLGNVFLDRQVMRHSAVRLAYRGNNGELFKDAAILPPVEEFAAPDLAMLKGVPKFEIGCVRRQAGLQQFWIAADCFVTAVAGVFDKGVIDVFNFAEGVGNDDAVRALLNGQR